MAQLAELASRRRRASLALAAIIVLGLSGCVSASAVSRSPAQRETVILYNGQHQQTTDQLVRGFEGQHPNITVLVRSGDEDTFDAQIVEEGARSPADVVYTENSPALEYLQSRGLLATVDASTLALTPSRFNSPQRDWVGVSARVSVLIYNPKLIRKSALPTHVLQLAAPRYRGLLAFAAGETDFQPIVTAVDRAYGKTATLRWLAGMKSDAQGHIYPDSEAVANEVNRGQVALGVVNQYYWYRLQAEIGRSSMHASITYFAPRDPGYVIDVSGAGVLRSSKHQHAAQELLAYLVSKQGQEVIANSGNRSNQSVSFEYPIGSGVVTKTSETPFKDLQPYPITIAELGTGEVAIGLLREEELL